MACARPVMGLRLYRREGLRKRVVTQEDIDFAHKRKRDQGKDTSDRGVLFSALSELCARVEHQVIAALGDFLSQERGYCRAHFVDMHDGCMVLRADVGKAADVQLLDDAQAYIKQALNVSVGITVKVS